MQHMIDTVLLKVASRCNINCTYCYVYQLGDLGWSRQPKTMSCNTCMAVSAALGGLAYGNGHQFAVVLHGGEPLLLGMDKLTFLLTALRGSLPESCAISIQTNGTLLTSEILDLCDHYDVTISLSLDGPRHIHDQNRIGFDDHGTFDRVMEGLLRLRSHPAGYRLFSGILAVMDPSSDPVEVYQFFKDLNPPSLDFIYRDGNHSCLPPGKASLSSTEYGRWMVGMFRTYVNDTNPIRIRIIDDLVKLVLGGQGTKEGVGLTDYKMLVIDTDGSITKNDTLKSAFDGADRFEIPWSVHTHNLLDFLESDDFEDSVALQRPNNPNCLTCPELGVCGGGMILHRWSEDNEFNNPSVYCADQKLLIGEVRSTVSSFLAYT